VHTLNGSGRRVGRTLIAILEKYQRKRRTDSVQIPPALAPLHGRHGRDRRAVTIAKAIFSERAP